MAHATAFQGNVSRQRSNVRPLSAFALIALCVMAPLWTPSPLAMGDFSLAFLIPFLVLAWALLTPVSRRSVGVALRGVSGYGLWIEISCVSIALIFAAISVINSPEPHRAFRVILPMTYGLVAMIALPRLAERQCRRMAYALLAAGAVVLLFGIAATQISSFREMVTIGYRFSGFFDNPNQLSLAIITVAPLGLAIFISSRRFVSRAFWLVTTLILFCALVLAGAKTALAIGFATAGLLLIYHSARNDQLWKTMAKLATVLAGLTIAVPATLWIISWSNPVTYGKIIEIISLGLTDYHSIQSRSILWEESWRLGMENLWAGTGAGSRVLDRSHSHNLILDYFRGIGIFGALPMVVLLLAIAFRTVAFYKRTFHKGAQGKAIDTITFALYLGALGYFVGNQISDSLSPSTSFGFWIVYVAAYASSEALARGSKYRLLQPVRFAVLNPSYREVRLPVRTSAPAPPSSAETAPEELGRNGVLEDRAT